MRDRLLPKLFLLLLATTSAVVLAMMLLVRFSIDRGFVSYLNEQQHERLVAVAERLEGSYASERGFEPLLRNERLWRDLLRDADVPPRDRPLHRVPERGPDERPGPEPVDSDLPAGGGPLHLGPRITLFDAARQRLIGRLRSPDGLDLVPIRHDGATVGWVGSRPLKAPEEPLGLGFLRRQGHIFYGIAAVMILAAGLGSLILARRLLTPVRALASGARSLAAGSFSSRVPVRGSDELAQLAVDFNHLAATLEANESARRRWVADISHELRTPIAVLRGEIEALQDGVRPVGPDALASLHHEAAQLGKLVEDLYQLALSDLGALTYQMAPLDAAGLAVDTAEGFRSRLREAGIELMLPEHRAGPAVMGDDRRLAQLFQNLLENSLRYTDAGGRLVIAWSRDRTELHIDFDDSAPGVSAAALPRLFERLYRGEQSRNRAQGGAGLGLAICANIAEAHHGRIEARPSRLGGLWMRLSLPLAAPAGQEHAQ